jgi:AcrR family transcriptional regulator
MSATPHAVPHHGKVRTRRERHRTEIRERLFTAALELFATHGFQETTVEDITEAADVGKGTFFNYFPTKEHVLATYGGERLALVQRAVERTRSGNVPVAPVIKELATNLVGQENPALLRAIYAAHASCPPVRAELETRLQEARRLVMQLYVLAQERGEVRSDLEASELARLTQVIFHGVTLAWALHPDAPLRSTAEAVWNLFWPNIAARQAENRS